MSKLYETYYFIGADSGMFQTYCCFLNSEISLPWGMDYGPRPRAAPPPLLSRNAVGILCEGGHRNKVKVKVL